MNHIAFKIISMRAALALQASEDAKGLDALAAKSTFSKRQKAKALAQFCREDSARLTSMVMSYNI